MMRDVRRMWQRLLGTLRGNRRENELADEIRSHIQLLTEENVRRGMAPDEAHRRATLQFGGIESTKESYRDQRGLPFLDALRQDLRYAGRGMRRNPGFTAVAVLSLAIGIGSNAAIFSLVDTVLLRPLAYKDPQRVFVAREVWPRLSGQRAIAVNPMHALAWAKECPSLEQVAILRANSADLSSGGEPLSVRGVNVSHTLFALLGVAPILGRGFSPEEEQEGNQRVVILSESLWRSRFNADTSVIGKPVVIDRQAHQVVGVLPATFQPPYGTTSASALHFEIYRPLVLSPEERQRPMGNHNYAVVVRLKPGVTAEQAVAEIDVVQARFPRLAGMDEGLRASLISAHELVTGGAQLGLWMLSAAVGAALFIVCVNLANLLLSRMVSRRAEAAIRTALGASRGRQFRMMMTESLLIAVLAGGLGMVFAGWVIHLLTSMTTVNIPRLDEARLDFRIVSFGCFLTLLTAFVFGALPAWRLTRSDPQQALRAGSHTVTEARSGLQLREILISVEVGFSAALLIIAGLLTSSLTHLLQVDRGFNADRVLTVDVNLPGSLYSEPSSREQFFDRQRFSSAAAVAGGHLATLAITSGIAPVAAIVAAIGAAPKMKRRNR